MSTHPCQDEFKLACLLSTGCLTPAELEEVFHELDTDGSGAKFPGAAPPFYTAIDRALAIADNGGRWPRRVVPP